MHEVISAAVDPTTALSVGLKVDAEALPAAVVHGIQNGSVDLTQPGHHRRAAQARRRRRPEGHASRRSTARDTLTRVGITCALCHSTVDNSFAPGIGKRLDGWPNRDLNPGAIIALSPALRRRDEGAAQLLGPGQVRPALQHRRPEQAGGHPAGLRPRRHPQRHLHRRRRRDRVLEPLRRGHADGRPRHLHRAAPRRERHATAPTTWSSSKLPALQAYQLSHRRAGAAGRQLRCRGRRARQAGVRRRGRVRELPQRRALHRRQQHAAPAGRFDGRARGRRATPRARRPSSTARRRCGASGSTRRTSTTARRRRWKTWSRPTTRARRWA